MRCDLFQHNLLLASTTSFPSRSRRPSRTTRRPKTSRPSPTSPPAVIYGLALHVAEIPKMGIEGVEVEKPARTSAREFRSRDDDVDERSDNLHVTEQMSPRQDVASMA